jgi:hypothetical protein
MSNIYEQLIKDNNPLRLATPSSGHLVHAEEIITDNDLLQGENICLENKDSSMPSSTDGYYSYILYRTLETGYYYIIYQGMNRRMICGKMTKTDDGEYILV